MTKNYTTMAILNFSLAGTALASPVLHHASSAFVELLKKHRFVEVSGADGLFTTYQRGKNYFLRKHGQCTVNLLKDGRVHVLHGPIALWNLHDYLTNDELQVLIAFATLSEEHQELMRNYMGPRCSKYGDVMRNMPSFQVDWKAEFLRAFGGVEV